MKTLAFFTLFELAAACAWGHTLYSYTGGPFTFVSGATYTLENRISGVFLLDDAYVPPPLNGWTPLTPGVLDYRFTDGHQTFTPENSTGIFGAALLPPDFIRLAPDGSARPWDVEIRALNAGLITFMEGRDGEDIAWLGDDFASVAIGVSGGGAGGTWTVTAVPEPATLTLLACSLSLIGVAVWRRRPS